MMRVRPPGGFTFQYGEIKSCLTGDTIVNTLEFTFQYGEIKS